MKTSDDVFVSEELNKADMAIDIGIDVEKYNEKLPYSTVLKNIARTSSMITVFALINQAYMILNTIVVGHANDSNMLAGLGLGQLTLSLTILSISKAFMDASAVLIGQESGQ